MKRKEFYALGIMSGTSLDGLDLSLIKSDGKAKVNIIQTRYFKFDKKMKILLHDLILKSRNIDVNLIEKNKLFKFVNLKFSEYLIKKIKLFFLSSKCKIERVSVLGIHGNTIIHSPRNKKSIQLGDYKLISKTLKIPIIHDFRSRDIMLGGEGAPLVPIFHKAIFSQKNKRIFVINIGGVSNFTYLNGKNKFIAGDIGPGNTLIDNYCLKNFNMDFDKDGLLAKKGNVDFELVKKWLKRKIFNKDFPRSYDVSDFDITKFLGSNFLSANDCLRTLTFFSAKLISQLKFVFRHEVDYWIFAGGGVKNKTLMEDLKKLLNVNELLTSENFGFDSCYLEASAFAYISIRTLIGLPSAFPNTTGCLKKNICGEIFFPEFI
tara:strand:- start:1306 stop:2433 length:1128 start_codon:yes stop_codon:yes gene_type:complete